MYNIHHSIPLSRELVACAIASRVLRSTYVANGGMMRGTSLPLFIKERTRPTPFSELHEADAQDALSIGKVDQDLTLFSSYEAVQSKTQLSIGGVD